MNKKSKNDTKLNCLNWKLINNVYCLWEIPIYKIFTVWPLLSRSAGNTLHTGGTLYRVF